MVHEFKVWFSNITGCAMGISDISWSVSVTAVTEEEALQLALDKARMLNQTTGLPPHGIHVNEEELRQLACVLS